jgi:NAD(P)-dependent dehydrogenase (short-subunit alcohol dehydrogenase family)
MSSAARAELAGYERVAIVTGSDSGIGRACAVALADVGFDVGITWHSDEAGACETARQVEQLGRKTRVARLDLAVPSESAGVIALLADQLGGLGVLVNSAAVNHRAAVTDELLTDWSHAIAVNLSGAFACAQAAVKRMVVAGRGGRIVNITSIHEHAPLRNAAAYCAAKAGLGMLTKVMALELAGEGITVNSVAPGHVATPMNGYEQQDPDPDERRAIPIGRIARAREIAAAVAHLASDVSSYTTGTSLLVDGGLSLMAVVPLQEALETKRDGGVRT